MGEFLIALANSKQRFNEKITYSSFSITGDCFCTD